MKTYTFFRHHAAFRLGSLAIAACGMAMFMNSCQDEDFGFVKEEIAASAAQRHYIEKFEKEFASIDPTHTWLCTPDTTYGASLRAITRAGSGVPEVTKVDSVLEMSYNQVRAALEFMKESEDNRGKCSQDFEYLSTEEKNVFDIHPVFWGQKFVNVNFVGIWYMDGDTKVDLPPFWTDGYHATDNWRGDGYITLTSDVQAHYVFSRSDNRWVDVRSTESQITSVTERVNGHDYTPDAFRFPTFKVEVPVGMKWGLYLQTKTTQSNGKDIRWYSNSDFNVNNCSAAASFEHGGINYVSFEDAPNPYNCTHGGSGSCNDCAHDGVKYGHYDHDMNDIVLAITPHPIESTYKSISYRVMCEDLGGTFDWDFNDLVLDVVYEEGKSSTTKAVTNISVQAVGGTLPIELLYNNASIPGVGELHTWFDQTADLDGMFKPINVSNGETKTPKVAYTIEHNWVKMDGTYDVREIVQDISVKVANYTTVVFPDSKGGDVPQCFMCPINVHWSDELINISDTYSDFPGWVASQGNNPTWWNSGFNTGTQEVVQTK